MNALKLSFKITETKKSKMKIALIEYKAQLYALSTELYGMHNQ